MKHFLLLLFSFASTIVTQAESAAETRADRVRFGGFLLEYRTRRLIDPDRKRVVLSKGEYALLLAFRRTGASLRQP